MADEQPVRIVLTPEQRELVRRMSGQHIDAIELEADPESGELKGGPLRFLWRLSATTGIPRQKWSRDDGSESPA
ncbi:MAG: hypothetical protein ACREL5_14075 [Gemmatimonadales bacterium]